MGNNLLIVEKENSVCTITLNRPEKRNALSPELLAELGDTIHSLDESQIRAVIIRGVGQEAFSAGYEIGRIGERRAESSPLPENPLEYALDAIAEYPYPVIAMIYGYAVGGGLELAVSCDLRIAADTARLGITPAKLGIVYSTKGIQKFVRLVGPSTSKMLFLTGRIFDASWAKEVGLVDQVVPSSELERVTYDLAQEMGSNAPLSLKGGKHIISRLSAYRPLPEEEEAELRELRTLAAQSEDLKEGRRAFLEKRKPRFVGR